MGLNEKFFKTAGGDDNDDFNIVQWTGTGSTKNVTGFGFQPDFLWLKQRTAPAADHFIIDAVRGITKVLYINKNNVEDTYSNGLKGFLSDGFQVDAEPNANGKDFIGYGWKAGGASTTLNQDGNVNTNVSVNEEAGFSIIKTVNTDFNEQRTFGHGLGNVGNGIPDLFIIKPRSKAFEWRVYTSANSYDGFLQFDSTATQTNVNTTVTSSTFKTQWTGTGSNFESEWIMYAFKAISGYTSFGTYAGNGSGQTITTGFAVRFVVIKCSTTTHPWMMYDIVRGGNKYLEANSTGAEGSSGSNLVNFLSTGFSVTNSTSENQSGQTYIYLAYA